MGPYEINASIAKKLEIYIDGCLVDKATAHRALNLHAAPREDLPQVKTIGAPKYLGNLVEGDKRRNDGLLDFATEHYNTALSLANDDTLLTVAILLRLCKIHLRSENWSTMRTMANRAQRLLRSSQQTPCHPSLEVTTELFQCWYQYSKRKNYLSTDKRLSSLYQKYQWLIDVNPSLQADYMLLRGLTTRRAALSAKPTTDARSDLAAEALAMLRAGISAAVIADRPDVLFYTASSFGNLISVFAAAEKSPLRDPRVMSTAAISWLAFAESVSAKYATGYDSIYNLVYLLGAARRAQWDLDEVRLHAQTFFQLPKCKSIEEVGLLLWRDIKEGSRQAGSEQKAHLIFEIAHAQIRKTGGMQSDVSKAWDDARKLIPAKLRKILQESLKRALTHFQQKSISNSQSATRA